MAKKYRAAIIGLGKIGSRYQEDKRRKGIVSHAAAYQAHPLYELIAGCDTNPEQRKKFAKRWPNTRTYKTAEEMLHFENPDVVSICTPPSTHVDLIKKTLLSQAKAVFCEKPLTDHLKSGLKIIRLPRNGRVVAVNVSRRWDPMHRKIAHDIQRKKWGSTQLVNAYYTGSFLTSASHIVDGLRMMLGEMSWVQALPPYSQNPNQGIQAVLGLASGALVFLHHLNRKFYLQYAIDMYFSKGRIRIENNGFFSECWEAKESKNFMGFKELESSTKNYGRGYNHVFENALDDIADCIRNKKEPLGNLKDSLQFLKIQNSLMLSAKKRGKKIKIQ